MFKWLDCYADQIDLRCHGIHYHAFLLGSTLLRVLCKDGLSLPHFKATYDRTTHSVTEWECAARDVFTASLMDAMFVRLWRGSVTHLPTGEGEGG